MRTRLCAAGLLLALSSCSFGSPVGVDQRDGVPVFVIKPCDRTTIIGRVLLRSEDDPNAEGRLIWSADIEPQAGGGQDVPLAPDVPGYSTSETPALIADSYYSAELFDTQGDEIGFVFFRPADLAEGKIFLYDDPDFGEIVFAESDYWALDDTDCHDGAGAEFADLGRVVAVVFASVLAFAAAGGVGIWLLVRSKRRRTAHAADTRPVPASGATRTCVNGHVVTAGPADRFCRVCGSPFRES